MKKKVLLITTLCLAIALCVAVIGFTFAWYTNRSNVENGMILNANGVLVLYFDANEMDGNPIKPAVARKGAITENVTEFNVLDENDPNIAEVATTADFHSAFKYLNGKDDNADVPCDVRINCQAYMNFADGTREELSLVYDVAVVADVTFQYIGASEEDESENDNSFTEENFAWGNVVELEGNAHLTMDVVVYFIQPDDLCNPRILESDGITVVVTITAEPKA